MAARKHTELAKSVLVRYYQIASKLIPDGVSPTTLQSVPTNPTSTDPKYIKVGNYYYRLEAKRATEFNASTNAGGLMMGEPGVNILKGNDSILVGTYNADGTYAGIVVYKPITEVITLNTNSQEVPTAQATESFVVPQYRAVMTGTSLSPEENYAYEFSQNISGDVTISSSNLIEPVTSNATTRPTYIYFKTTSDVNGKVKFTNTPTGFTAFGNDTLKPGRSYCVIMKDGKAFITNDQDYDIAVKKLTSGEGILFRNSDDSATISEITEEGIIKLKAAEVATLGGIKLVNRRNVNVDKISGIPAISDESNRTVQKNTYGVEAGPDNKAFVTIKDEAVGGNFTPIDNPTEVTLTGGATAYANGWFTNDQSEVITETGGDGTVYHVRTAGEYQNKYYVWNGIVYTEVSDPRFDEIYYEYSRSEGTTAVKANNRNGIELGTVPVIVGQRYLVVLKERFKDDDRLTIFMNRGGSDNQEVSVLYDNTHHHWLQKSVADVSTNIVLEFVGVGGGADPISLRYNGIYHVYEDLSTTSHSPYRNYVVRGSGYNSSTENPTKFLREDGTWQTARTEIQAGDGIDVTESNDVYTISLEPSTYSEIGGGKVGEVAYLPNGIDSFVTSIPYTYDVYNTTGDHTFTVSVSGHEMTLNFGDLSNVFTPGYPNGWYFAIPTSFFNNPSYNGVMTIKFQGTYNGSNINANLTGVAVPQIMAQGNNTSLGTSINYIFNWRAVAGGTGYVGEGAIYEYASFTPGVLEYLFIDNNNRYYIPAGLYGTGVGIKLVDNKFVLETSTSSEIGGGKVYDDIHTNGYVLHPSMLVGESESTFKDARLYEWAERTSTDDVIYPRTYGVEISPSDASNYDNDMYHVTMRDVAVGGDFYKVNPDAVEAVTIKGATVRGATWLKQTGESGTTIAQSVGIPNPQIYHVNENINGYVYYSEGVLPNAHTVTDDPTIMTMLMPDGNGGYYYNLQYQGMYYHWVTFTPSLFKWDGYHYMWVSKDIYDDRVFYEYARNYTSSEILDENNTVIGYDRTVEVKCYCLSDTISTLADMNWTLGRKFQVVFKERLPEHYRLVFKMYRNGVYDTITSAYFDCNTETYLMSEFVDIPTNIVLEFECWSNVSPNPGPNDRQYLQYNGISSVYNVLSTTDHKSNRTYVIKGSDYEWNGNGEPVRFLREDGSWEEVAGAIESITFGTGLNGGTVDSTNPIGNVSLKAAATDAIGGIKISAKRAASPTVTITSGGTTGANYGVETTSTDQGFVNIPWDTVITAADSNNKGKINVNGTNVAITGWSDKADLASPAFTGTPTAPTATAGTSTTQLATTEFVMNAFKANDSMIFKGTIGAQADNPTVTSLPSVFDAGWTYKVVTDGTYAGQVCEKGDMIVAVVDRTSGTPQNSDWAVIQGNIDGAVTSSSASSVNNHIAVYDGTSGKIIKDSGYTIQTSVPANAVFTDTWDANALDVAGYVAAPSSSDGNKVWGTDASGNPSWITISSDIISNTKFVRYDTDSQNLTDTQKENARGNIYAAAKNHTHDTSIATSTATNQITLAPAGKYSLNAGETSYIFTMPSTVRYDTAAQGLSDTEKGNARTNIGAASSTHDHTLSIATTTDTNQITLSANTKYKLTAGGQTYVFTTPTDSDEKVAQNKTTTSGAFRVLLKNATNDTDETNSVKYSSKLYFDPDSGDLTSGSYNGVTINKSTDGFTIAGGSTTSRTLTVTGQNFTLGPASEKDVDTSITLGTTSTKLPTSKAVNDFTVPAYNNSYNTSTPSFTMAENTVYYCSNAGVTSMTLDVTSLISNHTTRESVVYFHTGDNPTLTLTGKGSAMVIGSETLEAGKNYSISVKGGVITINKLIDLTYGTVTEITTGTGLQGGPITNTGQISLKEATTSEIGGVKVAGERNSAITTTQGGTTANRYYGVEKDSNNKLFVNIPWTDTTYSLPLAANGTRGGIQIGFTTDATNKNYALQLSSEKAYVNVPWTDEHTTKAGHYDATSEEYTPTAGSWTWNSTSVITGITKDSKGHITGVTTTTIANPNTDNDTKVDQKLSSGNANRPILLADTTASVDTEVINSYAYRNNSIYANPYTGNIKATTFNGYTLAAASEKGVDTTISYGSTSANLPTSQAVAAFVTPTYNVNNTTATPSITVDENMVYRCTHAGVTSLTLDVTDMMSTSSVKTRESIIYFHTGSNPTLTINGKANDTMVFGDETLEADKDYCISIKDRTIVIYTDIVQYGGTVTSITAGTGLNGGTITESGTISLKTASSSEIGGIKLGYTTSGNNYPVAINSSDQAYVNVPWTDTSVTSAANHYTPETVAYTPAAGSWTWNSTSVVTGITKDSKGHITGVTTTTIANPDNNTWRNIYTGGTSRVGTGTDTKAMNFVAGSGVSVTYEAAGTGSGQSGSADYFNVKIAADVTGVKGDNESSYRTGNVNITKGNIGLGNVTNNAQVKGLASGTTEDHIVTWGADGYTVKDSTYTIATSVPANAVFTDTWNANTKTVAGYVAAPTDSNTNKAWLTDGNGDPAWRTIGAGIISNDRFVRYDTNAQGLTGTQQANARTNIGAGTGTVTEVTTGIGLQGGPITNTGQISLKYATISEIGGVKLSTAARNSAITTVQGSTSGTYHGLEADSNGKGFVNINWGSIITNGTTSGTINVNGSAVSVGGWSDKANLASPAFTGTPTAPTAAAGTNNTQIATTAFVNSAVDDKIAAADAMIFKGTVNSNSDLPTTPNCGWTYVVGTAGTYAGQTCEAGDMIIAKRDCTSSSPATNADWAVVQVNLNGAVIGPSSAVNNNVALFDGTTGKLIKDSGKTLGVSVPSDALFTDEKVKQIPSTTTDERPILYKGNAGTSEETNHIRFSNVSNKGVTLTASTGTITAPSFVVRKSNGSAMTESAIMLGNGTTITAPSNNNTFLKYNGSGFEWSTVTTGTVTEVTTGTGLQGGPITNTGQISLKNATTSEIGGVKVAATRNSAITTAQGGTISNRYYGVETDSNGKMFVNIPWTDTTYTVNNGTMQISANSGSAVNTLFSANGSTANAIKFVDGNYTTASVTAANGSTPATAKFNHNTSGVTSGSYGPSSNVTGSNNTTLSVPYITVDEYGHITSIENKTYISVDHTYTIPTVNDGNFMISANGGSAAKTLYTANANDIVGLDFRNGACTNVTVTAANGTTPAFVTINHDDVETTRAVSRAALKKITTDGYGHIITTANVSDSDITTNNRYVRFDTASQGLSGTQQSNARANIGAGTGTVTEVTTGTGLQGGPITNTGQISLKTSTTSEIGGIKVAGTRNSAITTTEGGTTANRYYGVELDKDGKAFVNVPWEAGGGAVTGVKGNAETNYRTGNVNITATNIGLGNVTNNAQVKGLASGTTSGHIVTWGADGYTVADSGYTIATSVPSNALFTDEKVKQLATSSFSYELPILMKGNTGGEETNHIRYCSGTGCSVTINPNDGKITSSGYKVTGSTNAKKILLSNGSLVDAPSTSNTYLKYNGTNLVWDSVSGGGSTVSVSVPATTPTIGTSDKTLATITVDGSSYTIKAKVRSSGGGSVTSVATGIGLYGGPITTTGTISLDTAVTWADTGKGVIGGVSPTMSTYKSDFTTDVPASEAGLPIAIYIPNTDWVGIPVVMDKKGQLLVALPLTLLSTLEDAQWYNLMKSKQ